jgi:putative membrane protein
VRAILHALTRRPDWPSRKETAQNRTLRGRHSKATNALKTMVNAGKVNADIPTALDCEYQQKLAGLKNLWGQSFDDAYIRDRLQGDQNEISLFEHYAQNGDNATLRQWATKMLPEVKSHLVCAEILGGEGHAGPAREEWQYDAAAV